MRTNEGKHTHTVFWFFLLLRWVLFSYSFGLLWSRSRFSVCTWIYTVTHVILCVILCTVLCVCEPLVPGATTTIAIFFSLLLSSWTWLSRMGAVQFVICMQFLVDVVVIFFIFHSFISLPWQYAEIVISTMVNNAIRITIYHNICVKRVAFRFVLYSVF